MKLPPQVVRGWLVALLFISRLAGAQQAEDPAIVVEDIRCRGNTATSCNFILGQVYVLPGHILDEEQISNARLRLASLPNFESVDIYLEKGSSRGKVVVVVEVVESDPVFTEGVVSLSERRDSLSAFFAGRISHQNLFGEGRILDFTARGRLPLDGPVQRSAAVNIRYADPHLFGSKKYFWLASAGYGKLRGENRYDEFLEVEESAIGIAVGRRFADFSFIVLGYNYLPRSRIVTSSLNDDDTTFTLEERDFDHQAFFNYGWNSEDDYYFPTRGSAFVIGTTLRFEDGGEVFGDLRVQFRKTWQTGSGSLWSIKVGGEPTTEFRNALDDGQLHTVTYARPLAPDASFGIKRGRWYLEHGLDSYNAGNQALLEFGLKAGVRLELDTFGIVDLYVIGTVDLQGTRD